jgi:hypothetical protein
MHVERSIRTFKSAGKIEERPCDFIGKLGKMCRQPFDFSENLFDFSERAAEFSERTAKKGEKPFVCGRNPCDRAGEPFDFERNATSAG